MTNIGAYEDDIIIGIDGDNISILERFCGS
jgi:hypothetical protein